MSHHRCMQTSVSRLVQHDLQLRVRRVSSWLCICRIEQSKCLEKSFTASPFRKAFIVERLVVTVMMMMCEDAETVDGTQGGLTG